MKRSFACLLVLIAISACRAQVFDLIVSDKGDSIACRIERIEDPSLYFKMMHNNSWISTSIPLNEVVSYEYDAISRKDVIFREGSSYIASFREGFSYGASAAGERARTFMYDIQRNSLYAEYELLTISLNYERMIPLNDHLGLVLAAGISPGIAFTDVGFNARGKAALLLGGTRHFFETGVLAITSLESGPFILAEYRYQAFKGFLFRIGAGINLQGADDFYLLPGLSLGYSF